ncbi:MAG: C25 family cysteine peptidase, partial [Bacteroidales bacterium]|nr:C25 family cysteine peptidase [Bacteroidales bacterium]
MRKLLLFVIAVLTVSLSFAQQKQVIKLTAGENQLELRSVTPESFSAKVQISELGFRASNYNGNFSAMDVVGMNRPNNVGEANLPVISKLIEVPYGAEIQVIIRNYTEEVINLDEYGISTIEPTQPSYSKSTPVEEQYFVINEEYYSSDELENCPLITTEINGIMRGLRFGRIEIRPWHYNPVENTLVVYNNLDFEIVFVNADLTLTQEMKNKYYTPEFEGSFQSMLNYIAPAAKDAFSNYAAPLKYVIVANTAFESTLQPFVEWKTKQGYNVVEYYVANGTTNTSIKTYLEGLYDAATPSNPAPLYVLIIGDHSGTYAIPGFNSTASTPSSSHKTDVYFATYDGSSDYIPDLYYGRISAESTTELSNALNKILPYEQYSIPDGDYLNKCMLIAGVDASFAPSHGDGTIYYGVTEYFNEAHGFSNIYAYFHTLTSGPYHVMSSTSSAADADIRTKIGAGLGFANYTAHCDHDGWSDPNFPRSAIANLNNVNKYPFLIGNCCLSFQFDQSDAFGEMIIYAQNEGAIGYIGASNSSYWNEDVYWGIGLTSISITAANADNHTYANTGLGAYDGIWHENGEAYSNWYYTGRQIAHKGNLAVEASSSSYKKYYWEIYHLVGDPSIMPYMTEPDALSLSYPTPMQGATSLVVTTEPYTYVAISKDNVLLDADWSGSGTSVTLTVPSFTGETYCIVGTKQDRAPYINESVVPTVASPPVAAFSGTPTTILEGQSVTFTNTSENAATSSWDFGDTQTSTEVNPVHVYTTAGTYTVSLTVTNTLGNDNETKTDYITVNPNTNPPTAQFSASATTVMVGGSVNFTDLSTNNPASWAWTFQGASPASSTSQNPTGITYPNAGVYSVTLTVTNTYGNDSEVKTGYITVTVPDYCDAYAESEDEYISNFTFNTINQNSTWSTGGYGDYTNVSTTVLRESSYNLSVTNAINYRYDEVIVWIDYNMNGDFTDA